MGRKSGHKKPFLRKPTNGGFTYKWGPFKDLPKDMDARNAKNKKFCTAIPFSQGEDFKVRYVYNKVIDGSGKEHRYAYVECDYVK